MPGAYAPVKRNEEEMNANKAVVSAVLAGLTALLTDLRGADDNVTGMDLGIIVLAAVVAGVGTWLVAPGPGLRTPPAPRRGQAGAVHLILTIAAGVVVGGFLLWAIVVLVR
jgi:hypothetical protein